MDLHEHYIDIKRMKKPAIGTDTKENSTWVPQKMKNRGVP